MIGGLARRINMYQNEVAISAFYKFVEIKDCKSLQASLKDVMLANEVKGTIIVSPEGINGTISGRADALARVMSFIRSDERFADLEDKISYNNEYPFERTKVKVKKEVIPLGAPVNPSKAVGIYVEPEEWDSLIEDPETIVIDTRNKYEVELGTFKGAVNPDTNKFNELPEYVAKNLDPKKHRKIAMFCTGGIRCEKFSSYLVELGYENVYHLKGGILKYLEKIPQEKGSWEGDCYVFDERIGVGYGLKPTDSPMSCRECGKHLYTKDRLQDGFMIYGRCRECAKQSYSESTC